MQMQTQIIQAINYKLMRVFIDTILLTIFMFEVTNQLDISPENLACAILGSLGGSIVLVYFKREIWYEMIFKTLTSSIGGIFFGAVVQEYFGLYKLSYAAFCYFLTSLLSLIILKAIISFFQNNSNFVIKSFFQRVFNLQTPDEKEKVKKEV